MYNFQPVSYTVFIGTAEH